MGLIRVSRLFIRGVVRDRTELAVENLALRQQLAVLAERKRTPRLRSRDRIFWVWLSRLWAGWRSVLMIVQPDTVVRWHRQGFRLYWRWKSRAKQGWPEVEAEICDLIRCMSREILGSGVGCHTHAACKTARNFPAHVNRPEKDVLSWSRGVKRVPTRGAYCWCGPPGRFAILQRASVSRLWGASPISHAHCRAHQESLDQHT